MSIDTAASSDVLDIQGCLARFGGDKQLFVEITSMLLEDAPRLFSNLIFTSVIVTIALQSLFYLL